MSLLCQFQFHIYCFLNKFLFYHYLIHIFVLGSSSVSSKPSLRYILEDDGHDHNFIKVTPEFQEFVAKHLCKHLEK
jgi:hypothetical protein